MLSLLLNGQVTLFVIILGAIIFSLALHEYGHALSAYWLGDNTAQAQGRLTLNPVAHIDPLGLLMVVLIGFGYAKPVPVNTRRLRTSWGAAAVAAAGPLMNLVLAVLSVNLLFILLQSGQFAYASQPIIALTIFSQINLLLMLFNLIPIGPLDGHYIFSWLLPDGLRQSYDALNARFGSLLFLGLILLSIMGVPIFSFLMELSAAMVPYIRFVG